MVRERLAGGIGSDRSEETGPVDRVREGLAGETGSDRSEELDRSFRRNRLT